MRAEEISKVATLIRVSTDEQAKSGYSIGEQRRELKRHCEREGWEIVEEVVEDGYSGAGRDRPGIDRAFALAEAGRVDAVLAIRRDRFYRKRLFRLMADEDFEELGVRLISLNDTGNRIGDGVQDDFAEWEREVITERTRIGRFGRARSGKLLIGCRPLYGFRLRDDGRYEVDPAEAANVRRVFEAVAAGEPLRAVARELRARGVLTPTGREVWHPNVLKRIIGNDAYRPHERAELTALVEEGVLLRDVLDGLDPGELPCGVAWYGKELHRKNRAGVKKSSPSPREDRVAIPVPGVGVDAATVVRARAALSGNRRPSRADGRVWALTGGIGLCPCGKRLRAKRATYRLKDGTGRTIHYLGCTSPQSVAGSCEHAKLHPAEATEERVAAFILALIRDPAILREKVEGEAESESRRLGNADREAGRLRGLLDDLDRKRGRLMDLALDGPFDKAEISRRAAALDAERAAVEGELDGLAGRDETLRRLRDLPGLVEEYLRDLPDLVGWRRAVRGYETVPEERTPENPLGAYTLTPERIRHRSAEEIRELERAARDERAARLREIYEAVGLTVTAHRDGTLVCRWAFGERVLPIVTEFESPILRELFSE